MTALIHPKKYPPEYAVIVDFIFDDGLFFVALANISSRPVFEISVEFNQPILGFERTQKRGVRIDINTLTLFRNYPFLAPGKNIATFIDSAASYFERRQPLRVHSEIKYRDAGGQACGYVLEHNLGVYKEIAYIPGKNPTGDKPFSLTNPLNQEETYGPTQ